MTLREAIRRLAALDTILIITDFDGTLAPLVDRPVDALPHSAALAALARLAGYPSTSAAILSGRTREQLADLVGLLPGVELVGEHGSDWEHTAAGGPSDLVSQLTGQLDEIAGGSPGIVVEPKRWSVAFHYRTADPEQADEAVRRILQGPARTPGVITREGKKIVELHATDRTKGDAVQELRRRTGADAVLYLGDDVTDETAFAGLGDDDVGIKVGPGESAARFRVADTVAVVEVLELLVAERTR